MFGDQNSTSAAHRGKNSADPRVQFKSRAVLYEVCEMTKSSRLVNLCAVIPHLLQFKHIFEYDR